MGQQCGLSNWDIWRINVLYNCDGSSDSDTLPTTWCENKRIYCDSDDDEIRENFRKYCKKTCDMPVEEWKDVCSSTSTTVDECPVTSNGEKVNICDNPDRYG